MLIPAFHTEKAKTNFAVTPFCIAIKIKCFLAQLNPQTVCVRVISGIKSRLSSEDEKKLRNGKTSKKSCQQKRSISPCLLLEQESFIYPKHLVLVNKISSVKNIIILPENDFPSEAGK